MAVANVPTASCHFFRKFRLVIFVIMGKKAFEIKCLLLMTVI